MYVNTTQKTLIVSRYLCLFCKFSALVRYSEAVGLLVKPRNVATTVGTSATFECMSTNNASVAWYFGSTAISFNAQIAKADVYSIMPSSDPGRYNLAVLNPTFSKQGTYKCQLFHDETIHSSAELIVLGEPKFLYCRLQ